MSEPDVAIVGAGPAGVAVALSLRDRGVRPLLIERADQVAGAWRKRYDRLKLNTGRPFSHLPNRRYPKGTPMFPSRDDVVAHLDRHAREEGIDLRLGTNVQRVERRDRGWRLQTSTGHDIDARQVVVAIGFHHTPDLPRLPGAFANVIHSSEYRNPAQYRGKKVVVVGAGSSAMEIAYDLATGGVAKAWLAVRTPPHVMLRSLPGGFSGDPILRPLYRLPVRISDPIAAAVQRRAVGDLTEFGLPTPTEGVFTRAKYRGRVPALVDMEVIDAIKAGSIEVVAAVERFDSGRVLLTDGSRLDADAVILATGYKVGLEPVVGHLGVLDANGKPLAFGPQPAAAGLRFVGFDLRPSFIGHLARQSKRVAKRIARELSVD